MNLRRLGNKNATEVTLGDGTIVLFSYSTPVAASISSGLGCKLGFFGFIRTKKRWSVTTSKHINQWLAGANAKEVDQSILDNLTA